MCESVCGGVLRRGYRASRRRAAAGLITGGPEHPARSPPPTPLPPSDAPVLPAGWDKHSYGYHGDDGHSFCSSGTGQPYGPTFTTGDVIGCCVNLINNTCFYTKNGHSLGERLMGVWVWAGVWAWAGAWAWGLTVCSIHRYRLHRPPSK